MRIPILILCLVAHRVAGQAPLAVAATGEVRHIVRVTDSIGATYVGELRSVRNDTLSIALTPAFLRDIDARAVRLFEVRAPLDPRARRLRGGVGLAIGLIVGAGVGYLVAVPRVRATERRSDGPLQQIRSEE